MVALEGLKTSIQYLHRDIDEINEFLKNQYLGGEYKDLIDSIANFENEAMQTLDGILKAQEECHHTETMIRNQKQVLILYCQQFAYAPEIESHCGKLLNCKDCLIPFRFQFGGNGGDSRQSGYSDDIKLSHSSKNDYDVHYVDHGHDHSAHGHDHSAHQQEKALSFEEQMFAGQGHNNVEFFDEHGNNHNGHIDAHNIQQFSNHPPSNDG